MSFDGFDTKKSEEYAKQAKASWSTTEAYKEFEQKSKGRSAEEQRKIGVHMMDIFAELGKIKDKSPDCEEARSLAKKLQDFITEHFYTCTDEIFASLAEMYVAGDDMTANIDNAGGEGTAKFANQAIRRYLDGKEII